MNKQHKRSRCRLITSLITEDFFNISVLSFKEKGRKVRREKVNRRKSFPRKRINIFFTRRPQHSRWDEYKRRRNRKEKKRRQREIRRDGEKCR